MSYEEYIKALNTIRLSSEARIIASMPEIERLAYEALLEYLAGGFDVKGGVIDADESAIKALENFNRYYLNAINNIKGYRSLVATFLKDMDQLNKAITDFQKAVNKIDTARANLIPLRKLFVDKILEDYQTNGLNANFVKPLKNLMYQNIFAGSNLREIKKSLKDYIISEGPKAGKLSRYVQSTAQQAADSYTGAINKKLMSAFNYPYLLMSGSLIATSSPQCKKAIGDGGFFDKEYFETELKAIADKNGLVDGTDFKDLPFNKLHWGCRHDFTPVMTIPKNLPLKNKYRGQKQAV